MVSSPDYAMPSWNWAKVEAFDSVQRVQIFPCTSPNSEIGPSIEPEIIQPSNATGIAHIGHFLLGALLRRLGWLSLDHSAI